MMESLLGKPLQIKKSKLAPIVVVFCFLCVGFLGWYSVKINNPSDFVSELPGYEGMHFKNEEDMMVKSKEEIEAFNEIVKFSSYMGAFCPTTEFVGGIIKGWTICRDYRKAKCNIIFVSILESKSDFVQEMESIMNCSVFTYHPKIIKSNPKLPFRKSVDMLVLDRNDPVIPNGYNSLLILKDLLWNGLLANTSQIYFSFQHTPNTETSHIKVFSVMKKLQENGFNVFNSDSHVYSSLTPYVQYLGGVIPNTYAISLMKPADIPLFPIPDEFQKAPFQTYHRFMNHRQHHCMNNTRIGNVEDGGWNVCSDAKYRPKNDCLVYSFGSANSWSFDEMMTRKFGCEVHCFDPSMRHKSHLHAPNVYFHPLGLDNNEYTKETDGQIWNMASLKHIRKMLGHSDKTIDILKMDIEGSEWLALPEMISSGTLKSVRQLSVEYHEGGTGSSSAYIKHLNMLKKLYDIGFKIYWSHPNENTPMTYNGKEYAVCYEMYYVNTFIKNDS